MSGWTGSFSDDATGDEAPHPFAGSPLLGAETSTMVLEHDDDDMVGLFARVPFAPGTGPRVNLVPKEVLAARRVQRAQRRGLLALIAVVVLIVIAYALVAGERAVAREDLAAARAQTDQLMAEQARYAQAPKVYAEVDAIDAALETVMTDDVAWYQYVADLAVAAPPGLWLTSWSATVADPATEAAVDPATAAVTMPDGLDLASLTIGGSSQSENQVPTWLETLDAMPGLRGAYASSLTRTAVDETPVITFESSASMAQDARSNRYAKKTEK